MDKVSDIQAETLESTSWEEVAYHEAGHVVAAVLQNFPLDSVTVVPATDGSYLGCVSFVESADRHVWCEENDADDKSEWYRKQMVGSWAGPVAWEIHSGEFNEAGATQDIQNVNTYAANGGFGEPAFGLLEGIPFPIHYTDVTEISRETRREATQLLRRHWSAVENMSATLLEQRYLNGTEARELVLRHTGGNVE